MSISYIVLIRSLHPFIWGLCGRKPKCFPVFLGVLEFFGDPNAKVKIDLAQRLTVQEEEMTLCILYLYEFRFMGNKSFLPSVTSEKSRGERDGLYKQSQRLRQHTDLFKTGVRRLCTHEHSGSHLGMLPNAVKSIERRDGSYFHKCQCAWLCGESIASWSSQKKAW